MAIYDNDFYLADIPFIISTYIRGYDIKKANINIFYEKGIIDKQTYNYYLTAPKQEREIAMGMLQKDPAIAQILLDGFKEARKKFVLENNIDEQNILSIKRDAFYIISQIPKITKFGMVEFFEYMVYTSYYRLGKLEIYYSYINDTEIIEIKGINSENRKLHNNYFLEFLCVLFQSAQIDPIDETIKILSNFYNNYITLQLDVGYYRNFDSESKFQVNAGSYVYASDFADEKMKPYLNITCNLNILRLLYSYYVSLQMKK